MTTATPQPPAPRLSVIVPCAPAASPYIGATLRSILEQTFTDWELVLVLDGESEENRHAAAEAMPADRMRILTTPRRHSGPAVARHLGLEYCRGALLALCDADDLCSPDRFAKQIAEFDRRPELGLLGTWARRFDTETGEDRGPLHCPTAAEGLAHRLLLFNPMTTSTTMMRTELVRELGGFDENAVRVEDYDLWLRFLGVAEVDVLPEELVRYRIHGAQYSTGRVIGPQSALIRRSKVAAARRIGASVPATVGKHAAWLGVQVVRGRW